MSRYVLSFARGFLPVLTLVGAVLIVSIFSSKYFHPEHPKSAFSALVSESGVDVQKGVAYGDHPRLRMDIYRPNEIAGDAVILFLYGGGWKSGERSTYGFVGAALAAHGFTVAVPDYRLYPQVAFPEFVEDAARAYRHLIEELGRHRPIFLMGHSAGAHIAALLALDNRYLSTFEAQMPKPTGFIGLAGPYAFDPTSWPSTRDIFSGVVAADDARPVSFVSPDAPPSLLFHGLDDEVVRLWNMRVFSKALQHVGVPVRHRELEGLGHVGILLSLARPFRWRQDIRSEISAFTRELS